ncbi:MAG: putative 4-hydroxybenzoate polyprenyltransferase [Meiothermus sp.]|uniref:menaquinone biosynthesis prenyltransferase MqnP n=1 Tax=Meiothermus sp. TaxID=1955249 RepID=UPI002625D3BB|nr:menaquinone biosynthesis prenyltransferase MqnP [Meiothermus sp.]MCS7058071.1 putative 4-hydroxybenzoate polyprenyltransferase [Meiothermus sp.]MCX7740304.1 putative 4-hydroxybenzoate polyprenyltransferase [Meiothermus sp.]MDW8480435.1 menaquinone biosynthesis prenyltransferase MqnP [Meiothermus sp.]
MLALTRLRTYLELVRFEHTLFALPFAYGGMLLAARGWPGWDTFAWVTVAMVGARTGAMALNRLIDRHIDAANPRTAGRHLPRGLVQPLEVLGLALAGLLLLGLAAFNLNPLTAQLLPVAVFFLVGYSYTKRFTWLCHFWLGLTVGAAAAGGWIAVTGAFEPALLALWAGTAFWLAGFDILYATQDYEFDRRNGIHSIPARFGIPVALRIAQVSHGLTFGFFLLTGALSGAGWVYYLGVLGVGAVLWYEHQLVKPHDLSKVDQAFFQANVAVSLGMLAFILLDTLI